MKRLLQFIFLFAALPIFAQGGGHPLLLKKKSFERLPNQVPSGYCGWDGNYLVQQNLETPVTGYDHGETWTESGAATITPNYTGVVLQGTQSLRFLESGNAGQSQTTFAAQDEIWVYFMMRIVTIGGHNPVWVGWLGTVGSVIAININNNFTAAICGNNCSTTVGTMTTNTTYHVWLHYKKGSGINQEQSIGFSTDGIRPTSGTNFASRTDGTRTAQIALLTLMWASDPSTRDFVFDKIRVATTCIGDNPP
jgi:hypothetical protein